MVLGYMRIFLHKKSNTEISECSRETFITRTLSSKRVDKDKLNSIKLKEILPKIDVVTRVLSVGSFVELLLIFRESLDQEVSVGDIAIDYPNDNDIAEYCGKYIESLEVPNGN